MKRDFSTIFVILYAVALVLMAGTVLALLGLMPGMPRLTVEGLSNGQAVAITLGIMALIVVRLVMHVRARRTRAAGQAPGAG